MPCPAKAASPCTSSGKIFLSVRTAPGTILLGAGAADGHGIDRLEVAGIRNQVNVNLGAGAGDVLSGRAHVIFHVAAAQHAARVDVFESGKNLLRAHAWRHAQ